LLYSWTFQQVFESGKATNRLLNYLRIFLPGSMGENPTSTLCILKKWHLHFLSSWLTGNFLEAIKVWHFSERLILSIAEGESRIPPPNTDSEGSEGTTSKANTIYVRPLAAR